MLIEHIKKFTTATHTQPIKKNYLTHSQCHSNYQRVNDRDVNSKQKSIESSNHKKKRTERKCLPSLISVMMLRTHDLFFDGTSFFKHFLFTSMYTNHIPWNDYVTKVYSRSKAVIQHCMHVHRKQRNRNGGQKYVQLLVWKVFIRWNLTGGCIMHAYL